MKYYIFKETLTISGSKISDRVYPFHSYLLKIIKCTLSKGDFYTYLHMYTYLQHILLIKVFKKFKYAILHSMYIVHVCKQMEITKNDKIKGTNFFTDSLFICLLFIGGEVLALKLHFPSGK